MARPLTPATPVNVSEVDEALVYLRAARNRLAKAGAPAALAKVQAAIKSTEGALRHVQRRADASATRDHYATTGESLKNRAAYPFPRIVETTARATYWEVNTGVFNATASPDVAPPMNGSGYCDLAALRRLKGDAA